MRILLMGVILSLISVGSYAESTSPSQAFGLAVQASKIALSKELPDENFRVYNVEVMQGKYAPREWSDYFVKLKISGSEYEFCDAQVRVAKVSFAKQPSDIIIFETVINQYQVIGRVVGLSCDYKAIR